MIVSSMMNDADHQSGLSASETPSDERYGHAWESDDCSPSNWPDDSLTSAAGWSCTRAHTAWMAAVPFNLTNHPTRVVLKSWLHTVDWIKSGNHKVPETFVVLWHYDRVLPLQYVLCVYQIWDRNLFWKLHYSLSDNTSMFYQSWCAWNRRCACLVFPSADEKLGYDHKVFQNEQKDV